MIIFPPVPEDQIEGKLLYLPISDIRSLIVLDNGRTQVEFASPGTSDCSIITTDRKTISIISDILSWERAIRNVDYSIPHVAQSTRAWR